MMQNNDKVKNTIHTQLAAYFYELYRLVKIACLSDLVEYKYGKEYLAKSISTENSDDKIFLGCGYILVCYVNYVTGSKHNFESYLTTALELFSIEPSQNNEQKLDDFIKSSGLKSTIINPLEKKLALITKAEVSYFNENYSDAFVQWQKVIEIMGPIAPQAYYDRLRDSYTKIKTFPKAIKENEICSGSIDKHKALKLLHRNYRPEIYFEIGVQKGKSISLASSHAIGVDPMPIFKGPLKNNIQLFRKTSDDFFLNDCLVLLENKPDLSFIDGMHLFEYALRDFDNLEKYCDSTDMIVIDDIFPNNIEQSERDRCTRAWAGDVWKLKSILEKYRKDLYLIPIDAYPTGLLLITCLDYNSKTLSENYDDIVAEYRNADISQTNIISRLGAFKGTDGLLSNIGRLVRTCKGEQKTKELLRSELDCLLEDYEKLS